MRWAGDERRLGQACQAVLEFMQRHAIAASWGRADLASSDMMSLETSRRVWQARQDPRRQTSSIGVYSHVRDRWGIFHAQPIVLNERQAGAAIEGVVRQERIETSQLAVDTHATPISQWLCRACWGSICVRDFATCARVICSCREKRGSLKRLPPSALPLILVVVVHDGMHNGNGLGQFGDLGRDLPELSFRVVVVEAVRSGLAAASWLSADRQRRSHSY